MNREIEPRKFRPGESPGKPWGGNISPDPFPQALYNLARSRGYESQLSLSRALCKKESRTVGSWYVGRNVPIPDEFGKILRLLKPNDEELYALLGPYGKLLQEGKGRKGGRVAGSETARNAGAKLMRSSTTPFEKWAKDLSQKRKLSLGYVATQMGIHGNSITYDTLGLHTYSEVLQNAPDALNLSPEEIDSLGDSVARTMEQEIAGGHKFIGTSLTGTSLKRMQKELACVTYTGQEAADMLGITRERVRQLREKLGLSLLLTEGHIEILRERREQGAKFRAKRPAP